MTVSTVGDADEQQSELGEDGVRWHQMAIKMEGNTEMDRVLLGRTSEFQVSCRHHNEGRGVPRDALFPIIVFGMIPL